MSISIWSILKYNIRVRITSGDAVENCTIFVKKSYYNHFLRSFLLGLIIDILFLLKSQSISKTYQ